MKNSAPNEENQTSIETVESSQENSNTDDSGVDLGEFVADAIELVSSFFDD